jgi:SAM-dependent methyltransferase
MNLVELMRSLYETGDYFIKCGDETDIDYNDSFWGVVNDPDGKRRNLLKETVQQIEDVRYVWEYINSLKPGVILDVGCGLGSLLSAVSNEWDKYGIELSRKAAEYASKHCNTHVGTLIDCPYEDNQFDCITMYHVIEHVKDPISNIKKIKALLKNKGTFIIGTPDFDSGSARRFGKNYRLLDPGHIRLFSNDSMHRFLRDFGFKICKVEYTYFNTRLFTRENLMKLFDTSKISPPFYGNFMTFFCTNQK